ncbi:MAG: phage protease [Deltaproteobacteria bacterium]|nr:phage protease [Deltaproteobacteria bacterium]
MERKLKLVLEATDLPEWIRLLPLGQVDLVDGRPPFRVDKESLAAIVEAFQSRGVDLVVDYEHQSLNGGRAPAAGWIKELAAREDGLWARVEWTAQAGEYLRQKEYRYFSPVLKLDPETRQPLALLNAALTNVPAMKQVTPLVAKFGGAAAQDESSMPADNEGVLEDLKLRLGLPREATGESLWSKTQEFLQEVSGALELTAEATSDQLKESLLSLKARAAQVEELALEIQSLKARLAEEQATRAVEEALRSGKISPAQQTWAMEYCRRDLESFRAFAEQAPKVVPVGEVLALAQDGPEEPHRISAAEKAICRAVNIAPAEYLKAKLQIGQSNNSGGGESWQH